MFSLVVVNGKTIVMVVDVVVVENVVVVNVVILLSSLSYSPFSSQFNLCRR